MSDDAHTTAAPTGSAITFITQAWLVILLALVFGAGLTALGLTLKPRIQANQDNEALDQAKVLVPGATQGEFFQLPCAAGGTRQVIRATDAAGITRGWLIDGEGDGFADRIKLLVALDATAEHIVGLFVLQQNETPALGNKIKEQGWRGQFSSTDGHPMRTSAPVIVYQYQAKVTAGANEVEAVSAATISSTSVGTIVNATLTPALIADLQAAMSAATKKEGADHGE